MSNERITFIPVLSQAGEPDNRILIYGAGNIGLAAAEKLSEQGYEVVLVSGRPLKEGDWRKDAVKRINGSLEGKAGCIHLTSNLNDPKAKDALLAIHVAGVPRNPGESRSAVYNTNVEILTNSLPTILRNNPNTPIFGIANPVDELTEEAYKIAKEQFAGGRIFGVGSCVDEARYIQHTLNAMKEKYPSSEFDKDRLTGLGVTGPHNDDMQPVYQNAMYDGRKLVSDNSDDGALFTHDEMAAIFSKVKSHGNDYKNEIIPEDIKPYCSTYKRKTGDGDVEGPVEAMLKIVDQYVEIRQRAGNEASITLNSPALNASKGRTGGWPLKFENMGYSISVTPESPLLLLQQNGASPPIAIGSKIIIPNFSKDRLGETSIKTLASQGSFEEMILNKSDSPAMAKLS